MNTKPKRPGRPKGSGVKGHIPVLVALRLDQQEALVASAEKRRKPGERPPISAVVRDALDACFKRGKRSPA